MRTWNLYLALITLATLQSLAVWHTVAVIFLPVALRLSYSLFACQRGILSLSVTVVVLLIMAYNGDGIVKRARTDVDSSRVSEILLKHFLKFTNFV